MTNRNLVVFLAAMLGAGSSLLIGQKSPTTPAGGGTAGSPTVTGGAPNNPTLNPGVNPGNNNNNNPINDPFASRPIFLMGRVMFDDGSPMNKDVRIERACGANTRTETHVDSNGRFSFEVGGVGNVSDGMADASQSDPGIGGRMNSQNPTSPMGNNNGLSGGSNARTLTSEATLWGCELRASYPGYRSDVVTLAGRRSMDDPNVGTLILHRLSNVQGTTISVTTAEAPKGAQKDFEKGLQADRKGNVEEAEKRFLAATNEYPKYAVAWFMLGQVQQRQNRVEEARKSYITAAEADKHYVSPYEQLALLAARESKWADAAEYSKQAIDLNPVEFPNAFWYNTVSNYNLNKDAEATKSGLALLKMDTQHHFPEVNRLLAELAVNRKDYTAAADYLKAYLAQVPAAKDAEMLKQQLLKIEEASAQVQK
jgi:Tfp pilus assembly protein PilF